MINYSFYTISTTNVYISLSLSFSLEIHKSEPVKRIETIFSDIFNNFNGVIIAIGSGIVPLSQKRRHAF